MPPTLIQMDNPPMHGEFRQHDQSSASRRACCTKIHEPIEKIGARHRREALPGADEGECDFVEEVSAPLPIAVIGWLLGVPEEDWPMLFDWTNRILGAGDPEYQQEGEDARATAQAAPDRALHSTSRSWSRSGARTPRTISISRLHAMRVSRAAAERLEVLSWCFIIVIAGNETTRNGHTGGMLALRRASARAAHGCRATWVC